MIHIGCSGWNYRHWRRAFYPEGLPVKNWFAHYAEHFDTVEINASFYRLPKAETFEAWKRQAPEGFCYAVKAPRFITHMHKLKDEGALFLENVRHLGTRLGPILYQLPPRWKYDPNRLEAFLASRPKDLRHVFEFRDPSWITEEVLELLGSKGASFCTHDMPGQPTPRWATGPVAYIRFHGAGQKYGGDYSRKTLMSWRDWILEQSRQGRDVWAYFNNDIEARAIADAEELKELLAP
ncbi:DUF72 domain-containing protein [Rhizorhapis suberifaciens]|uniref:Uncharacterized protein YecE (DUF72 family) n=1 Tax=Rhizorhapis suberifaciens TaxID=13656 RepID=A0A840HVF6_9SPHN|nr:DUF72 domain-containing protein [Rhizorhapis suberifaciens]MBB4641508.1 uncharacterized protein YecE (DUF72 family) [Rhizorhapis suberifaciens]